MVQQRALVTRNQLAQTARRFFETRPYELVPLRQIATATGTSQSAIFRYWTSKADLWPEVMGTDPPCDTRETRAVALLVEALSQARDQVGALKGEVARAGPPSDLGERLG